MYELFLNSNLFDAELEVPGTNEGLPDILNDKMKSLIEECGGISLKRGLYRVHAAASCLYWSEVLNK